MNKEFNTMDQFEQVMLIDDLAQIVARLPRRDNIFAGKILQWFDAHGSLSAKQVAVVCDILTRNQGV